MRHRPPARLAAPLLALSLAGCNILLVVPADTGPTSSPPPGAWPAGTATTSPTPAPTPFVMPPGRKAWEASQSLVTLTSSVPGVRMAALGSDGVYLAAGSESPRRWDLHASFTAVSLYAPGTVQPYGVHVLGVALDPAGRVLAFEENNGTTYLKRAGDENTRYRFDAPAGLAVDAQGGIAVADSSKHQIFRLEAWGTGSFRVLAGATAPGFVDGAGGAARFREPRGLSYLPDGTLIVADSGNHGVRFVSPAGLVTSFVGGTEAGYVDGASASVRFRQPVHVLAAGGYYFVSDRGNHAIRVVEASGSTRTAVGAGEAGAQDGLSEAARLAGPAGMVLGPQSQLLVLDQDNGAIRELRLP